MDKFKVFNNKSYGLYDIISSEMFKGYVGDYEVPDDILKRLSKELGFSYDLYNTLSNIDSKGSADSLLYYMCQQTHHEKIYLLIDEENKIVLNYNLDTERAPLLNQEFMLRVWSMFESTEFSFSDNYYHRDDTVSFITMKRPSPIVIEEKYEGKETKHIEYDVGILIVNDESGSTYTRLVLYLDGQPLYLPASYYNSTTARFKRSTQNSIEALEVLLLKVIEDLRDYKYLYDKIYELHYKYRANKNILASYEEYNTVLRTMRKIPSIIEEPSYLDTLLSKAENFEQLYAHMEEQKSSYIWRCTALGDTTVGALLSIACNILTNAGAPAIEYLAIRELLGSYVSTNRIAKEIARADIQA